MTETNQSPERRNTEESPRAAASAAGAAARPEEGKQPGEKRKRFTLNRSTLLGAALFGAMLMNAVLLGLVSVRPTRIVERPSPVLSEAIVPVIPKDLPHPERHIDIMLGMADAYRRKGDIEKAVEYYTIANRAYEASGHAEAQRKKPFEDAEAHFADGKYRQARSLYFTFLATADKLPAEDHSLIQQAHYRIAECYLREAAWDPEGGAKR